jgi:hypothetical protein
MARASVRPDRQLRRHSYEGFAVTRKSCGWGQQARRWAVGTGALATLCALGFVAPSALADDLPGLPTTSLPTLPTTLPPPLGSTTAATTTTAETTTSADDGVVSLRGRPTGLLIRSVRSSLSVAVRAYDPSSGRNGSIAVRRVFVLRLGHAW